MKKFETPDIKVVIMTASDIIAASIDDGWSGDNGGNNTGWN